MSETAAGNVLSPDPQLAHLAPLLKTLVKDVFLAGLIQGDFQRNVDLNKIFEYLSILKSNQTLSREYDPDQERV